MNQPALKIFKEPTAPEQTFLNLVAAWKAAKAEEQVIIKQRRELEEQIVKFMPAKDEGSVSDEIGNYKVTATYKLTRSVDGKALQEDWNNLSEKAQSCFTWKPSLDTKNYKAFKLMADHDEVSQFITTKPAKPSVAVKEL